MAVRVVSKDIADELRRVEANVHQDFSVSRQSAEQRAVSDKLETPLSILALRCNDEAASYVRTAEDGNGQQAWQALFRAQSLRHPTSATNQLAFHVGRSSGT